MILGLLGCVAGWHLELQETRLELETGDGCSVVFEQALASLGQIELGGSGFDAEVWHLDLSTPGPRGIAPGFTDSGSSTQAGARLLRHGAPDHADEGAESLVEEGASLMVAGTLSCSRDTRFELALFPDTQLDCSLPQPFDPRDEQGVSAEVQLERLFSDSLLDGEGRALAQPWEDADADLDGTLTPDELEAVELAPLGYTEGSYRDALDLLDHIRFASGQVLTLPGARCTHACLGDAC